MMQDAESKSETSQAISAREHFVFTDTDGQVYHITVEGNAVKDGARIPPDVSPPPWQQARSQPLSGPLGSSRADINEETTLIIKFKQ